MAKNAVSDWSTTAANNTDIGGIDIAEGCSAAGINNALRENMKQIADWRDDLPYVTVNAQSGAYVPAAADVGEIIFTSTGGVTVPKNTTVALDVGFSVIIINNSGSNQTITQATDVTLRWAGTTSTGDRTLSPRGQVALIKVATDEWYVSGSGLS